MNEENKETFFGARIASEFDQEVDIAILAHRSSAAPCYFGAQFSRPPTDVQLTDLFQIFENSKKSPDVVCASAMIVLRAMDNVELWNRLLSYLGYEATNGLIKTYLHDVYSVLQQWDIDIDLPKQYELVFVAASMYRLDIDLKREIFTMYTQSYVADFKRLQSKSSALFMQVLQLFQAGIERGIIEISLTELERRASRLQVCHHDVPCSYGINSELSGRQFMTNKLGRIYWVPVAPNSSSSVVTPVLISMTKGLAGRTVACRFDEDIDDLRDYVVNDVAIYRHGFTYMNGLFGEWLTDTVVECAVESLLMKAIPSNISNILLRQWFGEVTQRTGLHPARWVQAFFAADFPDNPDDSHSRFESDFKEIVGCSLLEFIQYHEDFFDKESIMKAIQIWKNAKNANEALDLIRRPGTWDRMIAKIKRAKNTFFMRQNT